MPPSTITTIVVLSFIALFAVIAAVRAGNLAGRKSTRGGSAPSSDERTGVTKE